MLQEHERQRTSPLELQIVERFCVKMYCFFFSLQQRHTEDPQVADNELMFL